MPDQLLSPSEFAQTIKAKYPDYASVPDDVLAAKMLEKYPEYQAHVQPMRTWGDTAKDVAIGAAKGVGQYRLADAEPLAPVDARALTVVKSEPLPDSSWAPFRKMVASALPTVGGIVGGIAGGAPGAAAGGAAGQGYKDIITHAGEILPAVRDVARNLIDQPAATIKGAFSGAATGTKDAAIEAGTMAAGEGIGNVIVKSGSGLSRFLMGQAAGPTMALAREFPGLSQTMIENALSVSKGGLAKARALLSAEKATANAALDAAHAAGAAVPIAAATAGLQKTLTDQVINSADIPGGLAKLSRLELRIQQGRPGQLTMRQADALKTSLQNEARALYKSIAAGNSSRGIALEMVAKADMAQALNQAIQDVATKAGASGYKAANAAAQDLIGATRAISRRLVQPGGSVGRAMLDLATPAAAGGILAGGPGAVAMAAGTVAVKVATTPSSLSRAAIYLSNPAVQGFLRQLPKPVLEAIGAAFGAATSEPSK
jgi:hypothetical protein